MLEIIDVDSPRLVRTFVDLPYTMYAGDTHWVPPLRRDELRRFDRRHNPFLEHADITSWIARNDGRVVGRISAIDDRLHNERHRERTTWFGFFEAEDEVVARQLLDRVERHARSRASTVVRGPANPSLNESAGLLVDAFDRDPYVLMPYNPQRYVAFIESAGYTKIKDLLAWEMDLTVPLGKRIVQIAERVAKRHRVSVRSVEMREFDRDLHIMQNIYRAAWVDNWGFVPPTDAEIRQLAHDLKPILDPDLIMFAEIDGRPVACGVAIPNLNQVLKRMGGRLLPFGLVHFLRRKSIVNEARLVLLGVLPEMRRMGLYPLLVAEIHGRTVAKGYRHGEMSWTLEDNDAINAGIAAAGGRVYKTYRLYEKVLIS